ncbi:MAG: hypothetical protein RLZZ298_666 [Pseudomonadota bacterium]|jgi:5-carboxymethyl-2-hydroxymuconate isomerase
MPHLTLEYTRNLNNFDPALALVAINQAMLDSGLFAEADIKSRAIVLDIVQIGVSAAPRAFAHLRIAMLTGRSSAERKALADAVLAALTATVNGENSMEIQLSVETADLERATYAKAVLNG